jgi:AcrR family transcriptional regulator
MKISKKDKALNKRKIVKTAVELFSEHSYNKVTMRTIARAAKMGDATIYKYFPSKEKILIAYYELCVEDAVLALKDIENFEEYSLQEKIQVLLDNYLAIMLADREFVSESFTLLFQSPMFLFGDTNPIRKELHATIACFLDDAFAKDEIAGFPFQSVLPDVICEYIIGVLYFWIKDESDEFHETTQFIDMTLNLGMSLLKSGIINRTTDFFGFMLKSQMYRAMNPQNGFLKNMLNIRN